MVKRPWRYAVGMITGIAAAACATTGDPANEGPDGTPDPPLAGSAVTLSVLFIGNSLTYTNDLPGTLSGVAAGAGDRIRTDMVAGPKLTLMDHLASDGPAVAAVQRGGWDYVVLQQAPLGDGASREVLVDAVGRFDAIVRAAGARSALYMVWPPADRLDAFCESVRAAAAAADPVHAVLLPVGIAWEHTLSEHPALLLYDPDGVHPAPSGTYLAAITIYERLTGRDARNLSSRPIVNGLALGESAGAVRLLQDAAHAASSGAPSCPEHTE